MHASESGTTVRLHLGNMFVCQTSDVDRVLDVPSLVGPIVTVKPERMGRRSVKINCWPTKVHFTY